MAQKNLTDQQKKRIKHNQQNAVKQNLASDEKNIAQVIAVQRKQALVKYNTEILSVNIRKNLASIVCGDNIALEKTDSGEYAAIGILPRSSELARTTRYQKRKLVAANIDLVAIVISSTPEPNFELLDRYLLACEINKIPALIVQNKVDLLESTPEQASLQQQITYYNKIGYETLNTSAISDYGILELAKLLQKKLTTIVGQSGVGKSSITQKLVPDQNIQIGAISENLQGKHTTSVSYLYDIPGGGQIIDTPGIRNFIMGDFDINDLIHGFIEFKPYLGLCKFNDCSHMKEPQCAIRAAVAEHKISQSRFDSYCKIFETIPESH